LDETAEISLEANPGTIRERDMAEFNRAGINRISLGVQSFHVEDLQLLGRIHDRKDVLAAVKSIRSSGIRNLNLDLIYGLPGQTTAGWENNLDQALNLDPEHLSLYCLTIEEGMPLFEAVRQGEVLPLPNDAAADMYELAMAKLRAAGYRHYEISNWAKAGSPGEDLRCRHNLQYWRNREYYGFGAGAHGYIHNMRVGNNISVPIYINSIKDSSSSGGAKTESRSIPLDEQMQDEMMLGLRLLENGVSASDFKAKFGREMTEVFDKQITELLAKGLVKWRDGSGSALVLSRRGTLLGNRVFMEFVGDDQ
jgi:oxygen-independent coproporphyrinogen-3 oxidase